MTPRPHRGWCRGITPPRASSKSLRRRSRRRRLWADRGGSESVTVFLPPEPWVRNPWRSHECCRRQSVFFVLSCSCHPRPRRRRPPSTPGLVVMDTHPARGSPCFVAMFRRSGARTASGVDASRVVAYGDVHGGCASGTRCVRTTASRICPQGRRRRSSTPPSATPDVRCHHPQCMPRRGSHPTTRRSGETQMLGIGDPRIHHGSRNAAPPTSPKRDGDVRPCTTVDPADGARPSL